MTEAATRSAPSKVDFEAYLDEIERAHFHPMAGEVPPPKWKVDELRQYRPWHWDKKKAKSSIADGYKGVRQFAAIATDYFGVAISPMLVSLAKNKEGMLGWQNNQTVHVPTGLKWWEDNKINKGSISAGGKAAQAVEAKQDEQIYRTRLAKTEAEEAERRLDAKWVERSAVQATVSGALKMHHGFTKKALEKDWVAAIADELKQKGIPENQIPLIAQVIQGQAVNVIAEIEEECERVGRK